MKKNYHRKHLVTVIILENGVTFGDEQTNEFIYKRKRDGKERSFYFVAF